MITDYTDKMLAAGYMEFYGPGGLLGTIIFLIFACCYDCKVVRERPKAIAPEPRGFKYAACDCFGDCHACLHVFFCPIVRIADTYSAAGLVQYWLMILFIILAKFLDFFLIIFSCIMLTTYRGRLRSRIMGRGDAGLCGKECYQDFLCWVCCGCCTAIQEAREIDDATGVRVNCFCNMVKKHPEGPVMMAVGAPVAVQTVAVPVGNAVGSS